MAHAHIAGTPCTGIICLGSEQCCYRMCDLLTEDTVLAHVAF